jgi:sec-independent protein translocase protein TatC
MNWLRRIFDFRDQRHQRTGAAGDDEHSGDVVKPFLEHLEDLRGTLFKMAFTIVIGMVIAFCFRNSLMVLLTAPLAKLNPPVKLIALDFIGPFMMSLKMSFYAGIVLSFPFLLYFVAEFVLPALTRKERKMLLPGILIGFVLFACGVVLAYELILPRTLEWLQHYAVELQMETDRVEVGKYFSIVSNLCLACGFLCEVPIVVIGLALVGVVGYHLLARTRAYVMTLILIVVAIIAPTPDPVMFISLALPVLIIYEACIWIVWLIERKRTGAAQG